jgi:hypothetical protein
MEVLIVLAWMVSGITTLAWGFRGQEVTVLGVVAILVVGAVAGPVIPFAVLVAMFFHAPFWEKPVHIWPFYRGRKS